MGKNKGTRTVITLECACIGKKNNQVNNSKNVICRYTSSKNKRNTPSRLELRKFCKHCNCHSQFREIK